MFPDLINRPVMVTTGLYDWTVKITYITASKYMGERLRAVGY